MKDDSAFAPFRHATFRELWLGTTVSNTGSLIQGVAAAWTMTAISTADHVALVQTASFLPVALLALPAGALADIHDRRKVQMAALTLSLVGAALMTLVSLLGMITPWVLLGFCFLVGCGGALAAPARGASVAEQVPKQLVPQAVGLNNISYNLARSVGPAVGGLIVAAVGATAAFAANVFSYIPMLVSLQRWKRPAEVSRLPPEGLLRSISIGVRYVAHMQPVRRTIGRSFTVCLMGAALLSLMPLIARDLLGGTARSYGLLLGCFGIGAVSGIFVLHPLRARLGNENTVRLCCLVQALCLAVLSLSRSTALDIAVLLPAGMAWMVLTTTLGVAVQLSVPRWVAGRAIAMSSAATSLGVAVGAWLWGLMAKETGVAEVLLWAAAGMALSPLMGMFLRVAEGTASPEPDDRPMADPEVRLGIGGSSGPVSIELQYRVPQRSAEDFYGLMREIQLSRTRNGAYDWSLSRNIADPELWSERFTCPTWDDYLRLRGRRTLEDSRLQQRALQMHVGLEPIKVQRWLDRPSASLQWREERADSSGAMGQPM
ncbi:MFS transporter [Solimonas sp. K1W22B-7]|uniref:MFS transporter n=1 Tax=Solimonas sp. K1W22B-7 TaxID=2303331 RepID=UPI000E32DC0E|nr:MFS transporter [Solimonas sp. K1W22B-7]AXQ27605.1 MFS transporter [Solimonas sp. K1W22B-7]